MRLYLHLLFVICLLALVAAGAQAATNPLELAGKLQSTWQALSLPISEWRFKLAAEVSEDAAPGLDDSGWERVAPGHKWSGDRARAWYRTTIVVPERVAGFPVGTGDVTIALDVDDEGETFVNGKLVQRFDSDQGVAIIARQVRPGEKLAVAVRVTNQFGEAGLKKASVSYESLRPLWRQLGGFLGSMQLLWEVGNKEKRADWLAAAARAMAEVDEAALAAGDTEAFQASLGRAGKQLAELDRELKQYTVYLTGNSHIDLAWEWPWRETVDVCRRTFGSVLDQMEEYPGVVFAQGQAAMYEWMEQRYPELFARIRQAVAAGRWEIVGGMWTEPDCNLPGGESLVRQLLLGKRYFMEKFGVEPTIGWNLDTFGFCATLPQIYRKSGMDFFATYKLTWNDTTKFPHELFWWEGPDGSRLLSFVPAVEVDGAALLLPFQAVRTMEAKTGLKAVGLAYGMGDHGGGPTRELLELIRMAQEMPAYPRVEQAPVRKFVQVVKDAPGLPTWKDELYLEYHRGVYTTMGQVKLLNRRTEQMLHDAELFSTWARLQGAPYPAAGLERAWKLALANQMHDILPGTGYAEVYDDARADYQEALHLAGDARTQALRELVSTLDTSGEGVPVVVFNSLPWARSGVVELDLGDRVPEGPVTVVDAEGRSLPWQWSGGRLVALVENVPACGYLLCRVRAGGTPAAGSLKAAGNVIESDLFRVEVDPATGWISRVFDKRAPRELLAPGQAVTLQAFTDKPKSYPAWNIDADYGDHPLQFAPGAKIEVLEQGPVRAALRITKSLGKSTVRTDLTLCAGVPRVDLRTHVDWQEEQVLLKAAVPAAREGGAATYEIPYGVIERTTHPQTPAEQAKFEVPAQQWADLSGEGWGLSLLNDCKYGYDIKGNLMRLSLLRAQLTREQPGVAIDRGEHEFTYSLYPHQGDWRQGGTVRAARELNYPLVALVTRSRPARAVPAAPARASLLAVEPANIMVEAVKLAEGSQDWIIRWYETAGKETLARLTLPLAPAKVVETDLLEREIGPVALKGRQVELRTGPYEIKTIRIKLP